MKKCLHSDLSDGSVFSKDVVHLLRRDLVGQVTNVQHPVHLGRQSNLKNNNFCTFISQYLGVPRMGVGGRGGKGGSCPLDFQCVFWGVFSRLWMSKWVLVKFWVFAPIEYHAKIPPSPREFLLMPTSAFDDYVILLTVSWEVDIMGIG